MKTGDEGTVIGGDAPIGDGEDIGARRVPFACHAATEEDVIDAAVDVFFAVEMGPGDLTHGKARARIGEIVAVSLCGSRIDERMA